MSSEDEAEECQAEAEGVQIRSRDDKQESSDPLMAAETFFFFFKVNKLVTSGARSVSECMTSELWTVPPAPFVSLVYNLCPCVSSERSVPALL